MKKLALILSAGILITFTSCVKDNSEVLMPEEQPQQTTDELTIPIDEAVDNLYRVMEALYPNTRAGSRKISTIETMEKTDLPPATRSSALVDFPEKLVYVVNFENGEGYAVLGANELMEPIYCITEDSSLTVDDLADALILQEEIPSITIEQLWNEEDEDYELCSSGESFIHLALADAIVNYGPVEFETELKSLEDVVSYDITYSDTSTIVCKRYPMIQTKWKQGSPFNDKCPGGYPAGCVAVAVAQIMAYHEKPTVTYAFPKVSHTWAELRNGYYGDPAWSPRDSRLDADVATMMRDIGSGVKMKYNYFWSGQSFSTPNRAKKYLKDFGYYSDVKRHLGYDKDLIIGMLKQKKPVFIGAMGGGFKHAHAWVIDGYAHEEKYRYRTNPATGEVVYTDVYSSKCLLHCNFGWEGRSDGYYYSGVFDVSKRVSTEQNLDPGTERSGSWYTSWWYRILTY